jgi:type II secretory pathway component GspD/PulD (secretin)
MRAVDSPAGAAAGRKRLASIALLTVAAAALGGCTQDVAQYVKLHGWTSSPDNPTILSGSPERDAAAYQAASGTLTEADWRVLERIAPRAIWERLQERRKEALAVAEDQQADAATTGPSAPHRRTIRPAAERDIPTLELPGGKLQIFYEFQHYGGVRTTASQDGRTERRRISLKEADLNPIVALLTKHLEGKGSVMALPSENKLVITCPAAAKDSVFKLLDGVDIPARQVEITVRIFEVSHDFDFQYGAKALLTHIASDDNQGLATAFSAKKFVGSVTDPLTGDIPDPGAALRLLQVFADAGVTLDATFQALADTGLIRVVSAPRMTVAAGQPASMLAGQQIPIQSAKISNENIISEKVTYRPIGVQLYITPQVIGEGSVKLHVVTEVSAVSGFAPLPKMGTEEASETLTNPILDTREAETYVTVDHGDTLVIGGLRMIRTVTREEKVPGLGDIQLIEWLFKNHRSQKLVNDLYFFVTPHILR